MPFQERLSFLDHQDALCLHVGQTIFQECSCHTSHRKFEDHLSSIYDNPYVFSAVELFCTFYHIHRIVKEFLVVFHLGKKKICKEILFYLGMGSSKSLKIPAFLKKSDLFLFSSSLLIAGLKKSGIFKLLEDPIPS